MSTAQCASRSQSSQPGANRATSNPQPNTAATAVPNPRQQVPQHIHPGMYATGQDHQPGPPCTSHPHTPIPPHPFMYIPPATHPLPQPPPMPPFLQYQWPVPGPYSFNPFAGFPAMGYGMVMPPFPPNPYLEAPGCMLPPSHLQQVNYRRVLHAQFPTASAPCQSQNQNRIFRAQHNVSDGRETVSSEVQTEPARTDYRTDGSQLAGSESGIVANSSSATLSDSCREKRSHAAVENYTSNAGHNLPIGKVGSCEGTIKCGSTKPDTISTQTWTPLTAPNAKKGGVDRGSVAPFQCASDTWSVCSSDGMVPVCSSSDREDEVCPKLPRVSFSDAVISWVGGVPLAVAATAEFPDHSVPKRNAKPPSVEDPGVDGRTFDRRPAAPRHGQEEADGDEADLVFSPTAVEALDKILRLPLTIREMPSGANMPTDPAALVDSIVAHIHSRNGMSQNTPVQSPNQFHTVPDNELQLQDNDEERTLHDEARDVMSEKFSGHFQDARKTYKSVLAAESSPPYISEDWLAQSHQVIGDLLEDSQNAVPAVHAQENRRHRFSMSDESPPSQYSFPNYCLADQLQLNHSNTFPLSTQKDVDTSAPTETFNPQICQMRVQTALSKEEWLTRDQGVDSSKALPSSIMLELNNDKITVDVGEGGDMDGLSEAKAVPSPNQEHCKVTKRVISPCASKQAEAPLSNSLTEKESPSSSAKNQQIRELERELNGKVLKSLATNEQLAVEIPNHDAVSLSKANMVDCGVQCTELQDCCHLCKGRNMGRNKRSTLACSGRVPEGKAGEEVHENLRFPRSMGSGRTGRKTDVRPHCSNKPYSRRNRRTDDREETWTGYSGRPGKSKGEIGRNPRY